MKRNLRMVVGVVVLALTIYCIFAFGCAPNASLKGEFIAPAKPDQEGKTWIVRPGPDNSAAPINEAISKAEPGDVIVLEPGMYLSRARWNKPSPVNVSEKENLVIRSSGEAFVLCTDESATPMKIRHSKKILVDNIHFGHVIKRGYCNGGVVDVNDSEDVVIRNCVLHGSGVYAVFANSANRLLVEGCALTQCSIMVLSAWGSKDLTIRRCYIAENDNTALSSLLSMRQGNRSIRFIENLFANNDMWRFSLDDHCYQQLKPLTLIGNTFVTNMFEVPAELLNNGKNRLIDTPSPGPRTNTGELLKNKSIWPHKRVVKAAKNFLAYTQAISAYETKGWDPKTVLPLPVKAPPKTWVVKPGPSNSSAPIMKAIEKAMPGDTIVLKPGLYIGKDKPQNYRNNPLKINRKRDLTIRGEGDVFILGPDDIAIPLKLHGCENLHFENIGFSRVSYTGKDTRWLAMMEYLRDVTFKNCVFYGSGMEQIAGEVFDRVTFEGCGFSHLSKEGIFIKGTKGVTFTNCYFGRNRNFRKGKSYLHNPKAQQASLFNIVAPGVQVTNSLFFRNVNPVLAYHGIDVGKAFKDNFFIANGFDQPTLKENRYLNVTPEDEAALERTKGVWPSPQVRIAAKKISRLEEAVHKMEAEFILRNPHPEKLLAKRGRTKFGRRDYEEAIIDLTRALKIDPTLTSAYFYRALAKEALGDFQGAIDDYTKRIRLKPNSPMPYNNRACVYIDLGEYRKALKDANKCLSLSPNYPNALDTRGEIYLLLHKPDLALKDLNKAVRLKPKWGETIWKRGKAHLALGDSTRAVADFKRACRIKVTQACESLKKLNEKRD